MVTAKIPAEQRLRLSGIPWETYLTWTDGQGPRNLRVTYDHGEMEIMSPSPKHENRKSRLGRLIEALSEEMEIDLASFGSMTMRSEDLECALEGDASYYIQNESAVRGREDIDLEVDPPPDLAVEIEVTRSTMDRMVIYAALKVPEVWWWDGKALRVYLLTAEGTYRQSNRSRAFPFLPLDQFVKFLAKTKVSETQQLRTFRKWVREQIAREWKPVKGKNRRTSE
jgi:Uma2 family endonuclease